MEIRYVLSDFDDINNVLKFNDIDINNVISIVHLGGSENMYNTDKFGNIKKQQVMIYYKK